VPSWKRLFEDIPEETRVAEVERLFVRQPQALAEKIYGGRNGNGRGNGDGWLYRGRGFAFGTFKDRYPEVASLLNKTDPDLVVDPDLIFIPDINARSFIEEYFPAGELPELQRLVTAADWKAARIKIRQIAIRRPLSADEQATEEKNSDDVMK